MNDSPIFGKPQPIFRIADDSRNTAESTAIRWIYRLETAAIKKFQTELATDPDLRPLTLDRGNSPYLNAVFARKNPDSVSIQHSDGIRESEPYTSL